MDSGLIGGGGRRRKALLLALCKRLHGPQQSATSPKICTDSKLIRLTLLPFNSRILAIRLQGVIGWEWHRAKRTQRDHLVLFSPHDLEILLFPSPPAPDAEDRLTG
jgi:hypothetical protein